MGYLLRCFLKRCALITRSSIDKRKMIELEKLKRKSEVIRIWEDTRTFNFFCSMILPLVFVFVYATNYLRHTFHRNPDEVKMLDILIA